MIDDDADPATLDAWYRRTPEEIEAKKARKWNAAWSALRTPEHLAREPGNSAPTGDATDAAAEVCRVIGKRPGYRSPEKNAWANHDVALLDVIASGESPDYDVLATPGGHALRRIRRGPDGTPDYSRHPNEALKVGASTAAGRYQINKPTWDETVKDHPDLADFEPFNQDKGAWYKASDTYTRTTGRDLSTDLGDDRCWPLITSTLKGRWPSLPGGSQQQQTQEEFNQRMRDGIARYQGPDP